MQRPTISSAALRTSSGFSRNRSMSSGCVARCASVSDTVAMTVSRPPANARFAKPTISSRVSGFARDTLAWRQRAEKSSPGLPRPDRTARAGNDRAHCLSLHCGPRVRGRRCWPQLIHSSAASIGIFEQQRQRARLQRQREVGPRPRSPGVDERRPASGPTSDSTLRNHLRLLRRREERLRTIAL